MPSISIQQLFHSFRAHQYSSDQMKILKNKSAQTTSRVMSVAKIEEASRISDTGSNVHLFNLKSQGN